MKVHLPPLQTHQVPHIKDKDPDRSKQKARAVVTKMTHALTPTKRTHADNSSSEDRVHHDCALQCCANVCALVDDKAF